MEEVVLNQRGVRIIKEGDLSEYLVFIREGDFTIIKENLCEDDLELLSFLQQGTDLVNYKNHLSVIRGCDTIYSKAKKILKTQPGGKLKKVSDVTLGFLGPGSVFGDCDVVSKRPYRFTL